MAIDKLPEFAKDGQKNTDDLVLTDGFPVLKKPARQWFNWLFNTVSLKINEIIDNKIDFENIVDNLTTDDADKVASARTVKELQDNKLGKTDLKDASTTQKGVVQVNNTLTSTATNQALTAAQGKMLNDQAFGVGQTWMNVRSERSLGTTYTNTTGKPIYVIVVNEFGNYQDVVEVFVNNIKLLSVDKGNGTGWLGDTSFVVPAGQTYKVTKEVYPNIQSWVELR